MSNESVSVCVCLFDSTSLAISMMWIYLFIVKQISNDARLPISLKGNDILQSIYVYRSVFVMERMVNILRHLSVVVLGSLW